MSITAVSLYQRTRRYLRDYRDIDSLTAALSDTTSTTVTVADTTIYQVRWPIEVDQETMVVRSVTDATTMVVERGAYGSTAATHASGASVLVRPNFFGVEILDAVNEGIQACYPLIYKPVVDTSLSVLSETWEYTVPNMPGTYNGSSRPIPRISTVDILVANVGTVPYRPVRAFEVIRGTTPILKLKWLEVPGSTLRIKGFGPFPDLADYTASMDALWPSEAAYLPTIYAAASLLLSGEAGRVRQSSGAVDNREQANRTGSSASIGGILMNRFRQELALSAMGPMPPHVRTATS